MRRSPRSLRMVGVVISAPRAPFRELRLAPACVQLVCCVRVPNRGRTRGCSDSRRIRISRIRPRRGLAKYDNRNTPVLEHAMDLLENNVEFAQVVVESRSPVALAARPDLVEAKWFYLFGNPLHSEAANRNSSLAPLGPRRRNRPSLRMRRNQCRRFNGCDEDRTFRTLEKRGWAHMPGFTPARTRYQLAGKLAMKPRTIPICIMNQ